MELMQMQARQAEMEARIAVERAAAEEAAHRARENAKHAEAKAVDANP
jgi:hypothetical protein